MEGASPPPSDRSCRPSKSILGGLHYEYRLDKDAFKDTLQNVCGDAGEVITARGQGPELGDRPQRGKEATELCVCSQYVVRESTEHIYSNSNSPDYPGTGCGISY